MKKKYVITAVLIIVTQQIFAAGIVLPGVTQLDDSGSAGSIAEWTLSGDYTTSANPFVVGGYAMSYNRLTVAGSQTFNATSGMLVGPVRGRRNFALIEAAGVVNVTDNLQIGAGSISYSSYESRVDVYGSLNVSGNLDLNNGYNATQNTLSLHDGGVAKVEGVLDLFNHWTYGNCWLELDGGSLALAGDQTVTFADGSGILTSIKVWDEDTNSFQQVATYSGQTPVTNSYFDQLKVEYITDSASSLMGYTVVNLVPEPGSVSMLIFGGAITFLRRRRG